jgi:biopolymer transport protein TolR
MLRPSQKAFSSLQRNNERTEFRPQLTSLIDVMTFLLVFLIKSFSVEGDIITPAENLVLPNSISQKPPRPSTSIEITKNTVCAEGKILSALTAIVKSDSMLIPGVFRWASGRTTQRAASEPGEPILIQADREIEYAVLKKVMYSCSKAGCTNFSILAVQSE